MIYSAFFTENIYAVYCSTTLQEIIIVFDMRDKSLIVPNIGIPHGNSRVFPGLNKNATITYFGICSQKQRQSGILYSAAKI